MLGDMLGQFLGRLVTGVYVKSNDLLSMRHLDKTIEVFCFNCATPTYLGLYCPCLGHLCSYNTLRNDTFTALVGVVLIKKII
jgi:hypothetical protein